MAESLLPLETVMARVGFKSSKIYAMIQADEFPKPIKIGNASRWAESAIEQWIGQQLAKA